LYSQCERMASIVNVKNVFEAVLKYGHDEDFDPIADENFMPTDAPAGSEEKVEVLRRRVQFGQPLWHDDDRVDYAGLTGFIRPQNHSEHRQTRAPLAYLNEDTSFERYLKNQSNLGRGPRKTPPNSGTEKTEATESLAPAAKTEVQPVSARGDQDSDLSVEHFSEEREALVTPSVEEQPTGSMGLQGDEEIEAAPPVAETVNIRGSQDTIQLNSHQSKPAVIDKTHDEPEQCSVSTLKTGDIELSTEYLSPISETLTPPALQELMTDSLEHQSTDEQQSQMDSKNAKVAVTQPPVKVHVPPHEPEGEYTISEERYQELLEKAIAAGSILPSSLNQSTPLRVFNPAKTA
jgi:hypothetical protein